MDLYPSTSFSPHLPHVAKSLHHTVQTNYDKTLNNSCTAKVWEHSALLGMTCGQRTLTAKYHKSKWSITDLVSYFSSTPSSNLFILQTVRHPFTLFSSLCIHPAWDSMTPSTPFIGAYLLSKKTCQLMNLALCLVFLSCCRIHLGSIKHLHDGLRKQGLLMICI